MSSNSNSLPVNALSTTPTTSNLSSSIIRHAHRRNRTVKSDDKKCSPSTLRNMIATENGKGTVKSGDDLISKSLNTKFIESIRNATTTLIRDHGYSRKRAQISLLDQLVSFRPFNTKAAMNATSTPSSTMNNYSEVAAIQAPQLSDVQVFEYMRKNNIGIEQATIALTVEQVLKSIIQHPNYNLSVDDIVEQWTEHVQQIQPKPLSRFTYAPEVTPFGSPVGAIQIVRALSTNESATNIPAISNNPPATPTALVGTCNVVNQKVAMVSSNNSRSKVDKKRSNKIVATPPLPSTITISTPSQQAQHQRPRSDSVTEAVTAKVVSSSTNGAASVGVTMKGKPPLVPSACTSANNIASISNNNNCAKRTVASITGFEQQQQHESGSAAVGDDSGVCTGNNNANGGSSIASTILLSSSNKRQRRSSNSDN